MSQYDNVVMERKLILEAEKWASGVRNLHAFNTKVLSSMWYETKESVKDGSVCDIEYNDGRIERTVNSTGVKYNLREGISGKKLVEIYERGGF